MIEQIRYKDYKVSEIISLLTGETVLYSRRVSYPDHLSKADRISIIIHPNERPGILKIRAIFFNNLESVSELLLSNGFNYQLIDGNKALVRTWNINIKTNTNSLLLLKKIVKDVEEVQQNLPLMMYASTSWRLLGDYLEFMVSSVPKLSYPNSFMENLRWPDIQASKDMTLWVIRLGKNKWIVWIPGDNLVPVFYTQDAAETFAEMRKRIMSPLNKINIRFYENPTQNIYKLVDSKKSLLERISWLKSEASRLEKLFPFYDAQSEEKNGVYLSRT